MKKGGWLIASLKSTETRDELSSFLLFVFSFRFCFSLVLLLFGFTFLWFYFSLVFSFRFLFIFLFFFFRFFYFFYLISDDRTGQWTKFFTLYLNLYLKSQIFIIICTTSMCSICGCEAWNEYITWYVTDRGIGLY